VREKWKPAIGKPSAVSVGGTAAREGEEEAGHGKDGRKKVEGKTTSRIVPLWGSCGATLTSCRFDRINQKAIDAIGSDP
jgi:hypothetical protein